MKKAELLKQIELLREEVEMLKVKVRQLEINKKDRVCYPEYCVPSFPQYEYGTTGKPPTHPYYTITDRNNSWD